MNSLQLQVALLPSLLDNTHSELCGTVVIDTLRFTTTAAQALAQGCLGILVTHSIQNAQSLAEQGAGQSRVLLCGERNCRPIPGFDLGNSPLEYTPQKIKDRQLIFTTTNGTLAVQAATGFKHCLLGSLINRTAVARQITNSPTCRWQFICAGTDGEVAGEDLLAAGAIIDRIVQATPCPLWQMNDSAILALQIWKRVADQSMDLKQLLSSFSGGRNLIEEGYINDIEFASQVDLMDVVPTLNAERFFTRDLSPRA